MVELMLDDTRKVAVHPLVVLLEVLVKILHVDAFCPGHRLVDAGQRETALLHRLRLRVVELEDVSVDESMAEVLVFRESIRKDIQVDHDDPDRLPDLRGRQTDAIAGGVGLKHILNQLGEIGIVEGNVLCDLPQHRLTVCVNG